VDNQALEAALSAARDQSQRFDEATTPINQAIDQMEALVTSAARGQQSRGLRRARRSAGISRRRGCIYGGGDMKSRRG